MELIGRKRLQDWRAARPAHFFEADHNLQQALQMHWGREIFAAHRQHLSAFGAICAITTDMDSGSQPRTLAGDRISEG